MANLRWTEQASADLASISDGLQDAILAKVEMLTSFPSMGPAMDGAYEGFRQLLVGRVRAIYEIAGDEIRIAYIRHGARQLGQRLVRGAPAPTARRKK